MELNEKGHTELVSWWREQFQGRVADGWVSAHFLAVFVASCLATRATFVAWFIWYLSTCGHLVATFNAPKSSNYGCSVGHLICDSCSSFICRRFREVNVAHVAVP
jgi:hypothetical protein